MTEPKTLLTYSLISAWQWALNEYSGDAGWLDFMRTLNREPKDEYTEAQERGIVFEDAINAMCAGYATDTLRGDELECAIKIASMVNGGISQYAASRDITVDGHEFVIYGKLDYLKGGVIHDIKRTGKYEVGKYFDSFQKNTYLYLVPTASEFRYDVCDGKNVYVETYRREEVGPIEPTIREFMNWLKRNNLWGTYLEKWESKR